ncbi:MAG: MerR family transcriptional regulator [Actinobacteria bacterium]|nr:MerR family transcriptional regulator [Actinomycetota bacterium]
MAGQRIGAVLAALQPDFPDLSISKIRFLESEGLVEPQRSGSGYRYYSGADVERLRFILTAQRDRFWPLKVIRDALDGMERGLTVAEDAPSAIPQPPQLAADPDLPDPGSMTIRTTARLNRAELARAAEAPLALLDELTSYGLLRPDRDGYFVGESVRIVAAAAQLAALGIEARHLRLFRTAAEREVGLVDYAASQAARPEPADVALACLALHTALVKDELARRG